MPVWLYQRFTLSHSRWCLCKSGVCVLPEWIKNKREFFADTTYLLRQINPVLRSPIWDITRDRTSPGTINATCKQRREASLRTIDKRFRFVCRKAPSGGHKCVTDRTLILRKSVHYDSYIRRSWATLRNKCFRRGAFLIQFILRSPLCFSRLVREVMDHKADCNFHIWFPS